MILPNTIQACDIYDSQINRENSIIPHGEYFKFYLKQRTWFNFIKQLLHPSQFIPWDMENNCPLEKPDFLDGSYDDNGYGDVDKFQYKKDLKKYQQAEERVLFEGFEYSYVVSTKHKKFHVFKYKEWTIYYDVDSDIFDYTDLINDYEVKSISDLKDKVDIKDKVATDLKLM